MLEAKTTWKERRIQQEKKALEDALNASYTLSQDKIHFKAARLLNGTEAKLQRKKKTEVPEMIMESKSANVIKYEQRKSRIYKNKVEIIVYDNSMINKDQSQTNKTAILKTPQKRPSVTPDIKMPQPQTPHRVHKIKSNLFEQNQDFRKWKKYYDFLQSSRGQTKNTPIKKIPSTNSLLNTPHQKPSTSCSSRPNSLRSFPKLTINCETTEPQTCSELPKTTTEAITSENNIGSLSSINSPKASLPSRNYMRTTSLSPRPATEALSKRNKETTETETENVKQATNSVQFLKRVLSSHASSAHRRSSIEADLPKLSINSLNYLSSTHVDEDMASTKPSLQGLQVLSTKGSKNLHVKIPPRNFVKSSYKTTKCVSTSLSSNNLDLTPCSISRVFISNQGKESPKVMIVGNNTSGNGKPPKGAMNGMRINIRPDEVMYGEKGLRSAILLSK